jgi:hypothetical protein
MSNVTNVVLTTTKLNVSFDLFLMIMECNDYLLV